jgi:hypothetical protein
VGEFIWLGGIAQCGFCEVGVSEESGALFKFINEGNKLDNNLTLKVDHYWFNNI